jgi:hypothetical protein
MKEYSKDNPHQDIGKKKYRVRQCYNVWVEYDVVADSKDQAEEAVLDEGGIEKIEWKSGYDAQGNEVDVYANDWNTDYSEDLYNTKKVQECVPYEDHEGIYYDDPEWTSDDFRWKDDK